HDTSPPSYSDGTFDPVSNVNGSNGFTENTITFAAPHGLGTGQLVTYHQLGGSSIGLTDGRTYAVIVPLGGVAGASVAPSPTSFQLGAGLGGPQVAPLPDAITFPGRHNLQSGDSVYYFPAAPDPNDPTTFVAADAVGGLVPGKLYTVN